MCEITYQGIDENQEYNEIIINVLKECYKQEKIDRLYTEIILTNNENIKSINSMYRSIDKETDVLSFPMFEKKDFPINQENEDVLGDIIVSIPKVLEQAKEYDHSFKRELSYMIVHGFYHLLGYDHETEKEKSEMREKEEIILNRLNIKRDIKEDGCFK